MSQGYVGAGGWGYFSGGLEAYASGFRFVELNASFYRPIPEAFARKWRARVPADFVFAVKANRTVSHVDRLQASPRARTAFAHDVRTARILAAPFLILETPSSLSLGPVELKGLRNLVGLSEPGLRIGLEARAHRKGPLPEEVARAMQDQGILDVVDLSQTSPRVADDVVYTRLFGPGPDNVHQFDDGELRAIDRVAGDSVRAAFAFHGVRMYQDAARFLTFKRTGAFPAATASRGLASLEEVLRPDARFPASREELVRSQGWKVFDVDDEVRAHAS
ncbi:MAG TPA: DUF72 domain-containing protein, partial [Thermoanaerobaculia bacterium]